MADKKISELVSITGSATAADDYFVVVDTSGAVTYKISRAELNNAIEQDVLSTVDINGGTIDGTVIGATTPAAGDFTTLDTTGDVTVGGNLNVQGTTVTIDSASVQTIDLGDNDKIRLGDSDDLQIYHDGLGSYIKENGTGGLNILGQGQINLLNSAGDETLAKFLATNRVELYYNNDKKFETTNTGIDVTGTVTADGLTVDGDVTLNDGSPNLRLQDTDVSRFGDISYGTRVVSVTNTMASGEDMDTVQPWMDFRFKDDGETREVLRLNYNGNVGIGVTPASKLDINIGTDARGYFSNNVGEVGAGNFALQVINSAGSSLKPLGFRAEDIRFATGSSERLRIGSSGNVGIGAVPSGQRLLVADTSANAVNIQLQNNTASNFFIGADTTNLVFYNGGSERLRIASSGEVLVGTTDTSVYNNVTGTGVVIEPNSIQVARSGGPTLLLNRQSSDGEIQRFLKDGTTVGSIGVDGDSTNLMIGNGVVGLRFVEASDQIRPANIDTGGNRDNVIDLGYGSARFDDIYATNGTIQTSDANEKQQIAALTDAEITAAKAISALFKTFKWNDAVAKKGDAARTHAGVIAQDVQAAMTAAGLDAGDYAFFISSTWWETQTEVPAVEAVDAVYEDVVIPAVLDEDGNEVEAERTEQRTVTEAVEAVAAYTRTDTYDTAEEAPEGATERTRMGIRYPELLAFIGAATEQRLSNIETRLAALEA